MTVTFHQWNEVAVAEPGRVRLLGDSATVASGDGGDGSIVLTPTSGFALRVVGLLGERTVSGLTAATPTFSGQTLTGFSLADYSASLSTSLSTALTLGLNRWLAPLHWGGPGSLTTLPVALDNTAELSDTDWAATTHIKQLLWWPIEFAVDATCTLALVRPTAGSVTWTVLYYEVRP